jgi:hypothetical protein
MWQSVAGASVVLKRLLLPHPVENRGEIRDVDKRTSENEIRTTFVPVF